MCSNFEKRSEVVRSEGLGTVDTQDLAAPFGLRVKPDRRQRNVPTSHPDRRKRASAAPRSGPPTGKIEIHHR